MSDLTLKRSGCGCCVTRRRFLQAGCSLCAVPLAAGISARVAQGAVAERARVQLMFACFTVKQDRPTWPHIGYDFSPDFDRVSRAVQELCPDVEFLPAVVHSPEDAAKLLSAADAERIDGYLVFQMNNWIKVMQQVVASGKPTLIADYPFAGSGGFLVYTAGLRRAHQNFSVVASTKLEDLAESARCFALLKNGRSVADFVAACDRVRRERTAPCGTEPCQTDGLQVARISECLAAMKKSKLLTVGGRMQDIGLQIQEQLGMQVVPVEFAEFAAAAERADADRVQEIAARWKSAARAVSLEDVDGTLQKSARNYLAQVALLEKHQAEAITINCLGGFYGGHFTSYPCLGYVELLNAGTIGACEADLLSTATLVAMKHLVGRPGFISDPVLDTSQRQIVYAHCVAPTKMFGPNGPANDFEILSHAEDRQGASVRSFLPLGYMTSTLEIHPVRKEILFHRAKAVDNIVIDRACRTKLAGEVVGDMEKLFTYWDQYGWHRVTFFGDLREPVQELAAALKFQFVEEA